MPGRGQRPRHQAGHALVPLVQGRHLHRRRVPRLAPSPDILYDCPKSARTQLILLFTGLFGRFPEFIADETAKAIAEVVRAQVRVCPGFVPCTPDRVRGAAHPRSRSDRGASRPNLRYLPAHRAAREDHPAGHHRRYRRSEPGQIRPMAVAADADRRHDHQSDEARRRRDRLRRRVRGSRPAQPRHRCRVRCAISTR